MRAFILLSLTLALAKAHLYPHPLSDGVMVLNRQDETCDCDQNCDEEEEEAIKSLNISEKLLINYAITKENGDALREASKQCQVYL